MTKDERDQWERDWEQTNIELAALSAKLDAYHGLPKDERDRQEAVANALRQDCVHVHTRRIDTVMRLSKAGTFSQG